MSNILTNPNKYLVNVPELQNVVSYATGASNNYSLTQVLGSIDTTAHSIKTNILQSYNTNNIIVRNNLLLSNSYISYNGTTPLLNSQGINTTGNLLFSVNNTEKARITSAGYLGVGTQTPTATLDIVGNAVIRTGNLYISTSGAASSIGGNVYANGTMYAQAFLTPSDPSLKMDVRPLPTHDRLPLPVEFTWIRSGVRDIGFLADDVAACSPFCVSVDATCGKQHVDYAKLVTLCIAEIRSLRERVKVLEEGSKSVVESSAPAE